MKGAQINPPQDYGKIKMNVQLICYRISSSPHITSSTNTSPKNISCYNAKNKPWRRYASAPTLEMLQISDRSCLGQSVGRK